MKFDTRVFTPYLIWFILIGAFILRITALDFQSLWLDEIYTMNMADPANSLPKIYDLYQTNDSLSILYFLLLNAVFKVVGFTSFVARFYSVVFGLAGIYFVYLLGKELRKTSTGLIAATLMTVNFFHLFYSQEARVYSMYMAFTSLAFYSLVIFLKRPNIRTAAVYGVSALLMVLSHLYGLFTLVSQFVIVVLAIVFSKIKIFDVSRFGWLTVLIVVIGFLPVFPILISMSKVTSSWIPPITNSASMELYSTFWGNIPIIIYFSVLMLIFYIFNVFTQDKSAGDNRRNSDYLLPGFLMLGVWLLVPFSIPYFLSFVELPVLVPRYMISILPPLIIMTAIGIDLIKDRKLQAGLMTIFTLWSVMEISMVKEYYTKASKSDFRGASKYVMEHNANDAPIVSSLQYHFSYYFKSLKSRAPLIWLSLDRYLSELAGKKKPLQAFWVVEAHNRTFTISDPNLNFFNSNFEVALEYQSIDSWAKLIVPKLLVDSNELLRIDGLNFFEKTSSTMNKHIFLYNDSLIKSSDFNVPSGAYKLVIKSLSTPVQHIFGVPAHLKVFINGNKLSDLYPSHNSFIEGDTMPFIIEKNRMNVSIQFDNDTCTSEGDRNVLIREIQVHIAANQN